MLRYWQFYSDCGILWQWGRRAEHLLPCSPPVTLLIICHSQLLVKMVLALNQFFEGFEEEEVIKMYNWWVWLFTGDEQWSARNCFGLIRLWWGGFQLQQEINTMRWYWIQLYILGQSLDWQRASRYTEVVAGDVTAPGSSHRGLFGSVRSLNKTLHKLENLWDWPEIYILWSENCLKIALGTFARAHRHWRSQSRSFQINFDSPSSILSKEVKAWVYEMCNNPGSLCSFCSRCPCLRCKNEMIE